MDSFDIDAFDDQSFDDQSFDLSAGSVPTVPTFVGPAISDMTLVVDLPISPRDFSGRFADDGAMTFTVVGTLPTGLSLSSAGVLTGTPTVQGLTSSLEIRADDGSDTADSNSFSINVVAASAGGAYAARSRLGLGIGLG